MKTTQTTKITGTVILAGANLTRGNLTHSRTGPGLMATPGCGRRSGMVVGRVLHERREGGDRGVSGVHFAGHSERGFFAWQSIADFFR